MKNITNIRLKIAMLFFIGIIFVITVRLYNIQINKYKYYKTRAKRQHSRKVILHRPRGSIIDRNSNILAKSLVTYSVYASSREFIEYRSTINKLSSILGMEKEEILKALLRSRYFSWIKRNISREEKEALSRAKLKGVHLKTEDKRFYPNDSLAAHIVGFVGREKQLGLEGVEYKYERYLTAEAGYKIYESDVRGYEIPQGKTVVKEPKGGNSIRLTIDSNIQDIVEKEVLKAAEEFKPLSISALLMNPHTGEILAMVNYPTYNLNEYNKSEDYERRNRIVTDMYEPGSTLKLLAVAAIGVEEKLIGDSQLFYCPGYKKIGSFEIKCHQEHGYLSFDDVIAKSCNSGTIELAMKIGKKRMSRYLRDFGLGKKTGIGLPGEIRGILRNYKRWADIDLAATSIGQSVGVTPLQLLNAINTIINGGKMLKPYVIYSIETFDGKIIKRNVPEIVKHVISEETSKRVRQMMERVVESGTGSKVKMDYFGVGAKTGTAQKIEKDGTYSKHRYVASMVGFAPYFTEPRFSLLVVVNEPKGKIYGGEVAAKPFRSICDQVLKYLTEHPDKPIDNKVTNLVDYSYALIEDFRGLEREDVKSECARAGLRFKFYGNGDIIKYQYPFPGSRIKRNNNFLHFFTSTQKEFDKPESDKTVPFLLGMTENEVILELEKRKIKCKITEGTGYVIEQSIEPGSFLDDQKILILKLGELY
ncbi:PASTA domain-containing protein [bacterium]|nr:PASTA domain-containing protein [bacterium]